jgi:carbamoylphosphate synthase large subunit
MKRSQIEKELKRNALCEIKLRGVYSLMKTIANQAIIYKNNVKYSGDMNLHITIYLRPNKINPNPRIIQKEKEKAVLMTIGFPKTFEIIPETKITL